MEKEVLASLNKQTLHSTKEVGNILANKLNHKIKDVSFANIWNAADLGLNDISSFSKSDKETQDLIKSEIAIGRFKEAYFIEKAGMCFAAKMSLLAESLDEQKLYSIFSAEEATHFQFIEQILGDHVDNSNQDSFIKLLNEVIATGQRRPLQFIIQVVLEGWGIDHYGRMERTCVHTEIKEFLKRILADEAGHHGSGLSMFNENDLTDQEQTYIIDMMVQFIGLVNIGPVGDAAIVKSHLPSLSESEIYTQLDAGVQTQRKLDYLKKLMEKANAHNTLAKLDGHKLFIPQF